MNGRYIAIIVATTLLVTSLAALSFAPGSANEETETNDTVGTAPDDQSTRSTSLEQSATLEQPMVDPNVQLLYADDNDDEDAAGTSREGGDRTATRTLGGGGGGGGGGSSRLDDRDEEGKDDLSVQPDEADPTNPEAEITKTIAPPHCMDGATLNAVVTCLIDRIPRDLDWTAPTNAQRDAWYQEVNNALGGSCPEQSQTLFDGVYVVAPFTGSDGSKHCIFLENDDGMTGWGSLIVRQGPARPLHLQVPYPLFALGTGEQGLGVYQDTEAASLLVAGAHRHADEKPGCQERSITDMANGCRNLFQATTRSLLDHAKRHETDFTTLQFHGMAASTCPTTDIHLSDGTGDAPDDASKAGRLRTALQETHPDWTVTLTGEDPCHMNGQTSTQGRLLNGVPADRVADTYAKSSSGLFLHVAQNPGTRAPDGWADPLRTAFPLNDAPTIDPPEHEDIIAEPVVEPPACLDTDTITVVVQCIAGRMPREIEWVHPNDAERDEWRQSVTAVLNEGCPDAAQSLLGERYVIAPFADPDGSRHCILTETDESPSGWGTLIVREPPARNLALQVSHPLYDLGTWEQSLGFYEALDAHSLLLAGTHRYADGAPGCRDRAVTDMSHACGTLYQSSVESLLDHVQQTGTDITAIQFHGMAARTCPDTQVHISPGTTTSPPEGSKARLLQSALMDANPDWIVTVPGEGDCAMNATTNVQGRLLNGVPADQVADTFAEQASGRFLHIEQNPENRGTTDWLDAINAVWPAG